MIFATTPHELRPRRSQLKRMYIFESYLIIDFQGLAENYSPTTIRLYFELFTMIVAQALLRRHATLCARPVE